jgi:hypothetical protein
MEEAKGELLVCCTCYCTSLAEYPGEIFGGNDIVAVLVFGGRCREQLLDEMYVFDRLVWLKGSVKA